LEIEFKDLKLEPSFIREIIFTPSQSIRMSVIHAPESDSERQVSMQYSLHFQGVHSCSFKFDARPWLEIKTHKTLLSSQYLDQYQEARQGQTSSSEDQSGLGHFQFILDEGQIDIIAEHFASAIDKEMPHHGSAIL
jgi:hypothetical protein